MAYRRVLDGTSSCSARDQDVQGDPTDCSISVSTEHEPVPVEFSGARHASYHETGQRTTNLASELLYQEMGTWSGSIQQVMNAEDGLEADLANLAPSQTAVIEVNCRLEPLSGKFALFSPDVIANIRTDRSLHLQEFDDGLLYPSPAHDIGIALWDNAEGTVTDLAWSDAEHTDHRDVEMNLSVDHRNSTFHRDSGRLMLRILGVIVCIGMSFGVREMMYRVIERCSTYIVLEALGLVLLLAFVLMAVGRP